MPIYTANFARQKQLPPDLRPLCIARWPPRGWKGDRYPALTPPAESLKAARAGKITLAEFIETYQSQLAALDPQAVARDLEGAVLLCFEPPGFCCHRRLVAEWLEAALKIEVCEWSFARDLIYPAAESPIQGVTPHDALPWRARCDHCRRDQAVALGEGERLCVKCGRRFKIIWD